jgi:hypothetical protein
MESLKAKANRMMKNKESTITAGDEPLEEWELNGIGVRHLPADEHGILRISVGGGVKQAPLNYCVFRGDKGKCIDLLRKALKALESH